LPDAKDYLIEAEYKDNVEHTNTLTQQEYLEFYSDLILKLKSSLPGNYPNPSPSSYYQIPTDISGIHFELGFHGRPRSWFGVELHFEKNNKEENQKYIEKIEELKSTIEKDLEVEVTFQRDWGEKWARVYIQKPEGKMTDELKDWAVNKMVILIKLLRPELSKIKIQ
jgi:hypothetical protein